MLPGQLAEMLGKAVKGDELARRSLYDFLLENDEASAATALDEVLLFATLKNSLNEMRSFVLSYGRGRVCVIPYPNGTMRVRAYIDRETMYRPEQWGDGLRPDQVKGVVDALLENLRVETKINDEVREMEETEEEAEAEELLRMSGAAFRIPDAARRRVNREMGHHVEDDELRMALAMYNHMDAETLFAHIDELSDDDEPERDWEEPIMQMRIVLATRTDTGRRLSNATRTTGGNTRQGPERRRAGQE